jgi:hypothetical protein
MQEYSIYHAVNPTFDEEFVQERSLVGTVQASSLDEAYSLSQNFDKNWNELNPCRSTSVGDVIRGEEGFFLVAGFGFKELN